MNIHNNNEIIQFNTLLRRGTGREMYYALCEKVTRHKIISLVKNNSK